MLKESNLETYYIALIPPQEIRDEIQDFQLLAEQKFGSKISLRSPSHITLIPPFNATEKELSLIIRKVTTRLEEKYYPIDTSITGFYHFNYRAIILEINKTKVLDVLFNDLMLLTSDIVINQNYNRFSPHITIANRDLSPEIFDTAYSYFSHIAYTRDFISKEVAIFIFKDAKWEEVAKISL